MILTMSKLAKVTIQRNSRRTNFRMVFHEWAAGTRTPRATTSAIKFVLAFGTACLAAPLICIRKLSTLSNVQREQRHIGVKRRVDAIKAI
jgi:hypothetical protein